MKELIIVGAGGFGREALYLIEEINRIEKKWTIKGFINDKLDALDGFDCGYKILGRIIDWEPKENETFVLAIADPKGKEKVVKALKARGAHFETIIAPSATVSDRTVLGEGVIAFGGTGISVDCKVGDFVFFNARTMVGHDSIIGDYCTIAPNVCLSGKTQMGRCVNVGVLASTYPGVKIGDYATIGMSSAVIRNVKEGTTVIGVPATRI